MTAAAILKTALRIGDPVVVRECGCKLIRLGVSALADAGGVIEDTSPFWQQVHKDQGFLDHRVYAVRFANGALANLCEHMVRPA